MYLKTLEFCSPFGHSVDISASSSLGRRPLMGGRSNSFWQQACSPFS
jgi:hypothetical protein